MKRLLILGVFCLLSGCNDQSADSAKPTIGAVPRAATAAPAGAPQIVNGDFEQTASDGSIPGWDQVQHAGEKSYEMRIDADGAYAGHGSFHMIRTKPQVYGSLTQALDLGAYAGKTLELSAMLKSRDVGPDGWKLMVNGNLAGTLQYSQGLTGNTEWQRQSVTLKLPPNARRVTIGVTLLDAGEGWADNIEAKVLD